MILCMFVLNVFFLFVVAIVVGVFIGWVELDWLVGVFCFSGVRTCSGPFFVFSNAAEVKSVAKVCVLLRCFSSRRLKMFLIQIKSEPRPSRCTLKKHVFFLAS